MLKSWIITRRNLLLLPIVAVLGIGVVGVQTIVGSSPPPPLAVNQTEGFGNEKKLVFDYFQNFQCVHDPFDDLDGPGHLGDGQVAAADPDEFQPPQCIAALSGDALPQIDPAGEPIEKTEPLYVIVPFFESPLDADSTLEALDTTPAVAVQCPEPGRPFGTCTMHPGTGATSQALHVEPIASLVGLPDHLPLVNHSHIIDGDNFGPIWWQVNVVLVCDEAAWPDAAGTTGLTSVDALKKAQATSASTPTSGSCFGKQATPSVPTNFFLFFDAHPADGGGHHH